MVKNYPIRILMAFLVFTEVLFFVGPIYYEIGNNIGLIIYFLVVNLALYWGYSQGVKHFVPSNKRISDLAIKVILVIGLFSTIRSVSNSWANHGLSFSFAALLNSIANPGEAYHGSGENYYGSFFDMTLLTPFRLAVIPLGIYYWERLPKIYRWLVVLTILLQIILGLGVGVRKQLLDVVLISIFTFTAKNPSYIEDPIQRRKVRIIVIPVILVFLVYFTFSIASRYGYGWDELFTLKGEQTREFYLKHMPPWLAYSLRSITSYLCQGYYALAKGLEIGIKDIAMFGDSWVSIYYSKKLFGFDPTPMTYMASLEPLGIDMRVNWHTMYLWLANQYTFIGVPFIVYIIGYFFAQSWNDTVFGHNGFSVIVLSFFIVMVFYMFANNQVFSDSAISFWVWFIIYQVSRQK